MSNKYVVGNWKMNGNLEEDLQRASAIAEYVRNNSTKTQVVICPAFHELSAITFIAKNVSKGALKVGSQDCHFKEKGAYTGDISPVMLKEVGCDYAIVGHSERRQYHHESNEIVKDKAKLAIEHGLIPIICIGETKLEYEQGKTSDVLEKQIKESIPENANATNTLIAYEPVWAIGTGLTPTNAEIETTHTNIKKLCTSPFAILYGGSVNAKNSKEILSINGVSGALVGGASLILEDFIKIIESI